MKGFLIVSLPTIGYDSSQRFPNSVPTQNLDVHVPRFAISLQSDVISNQPDDQHWQKELPYQRAFLIRMPSQPAAHNGWSAAAAACSLPIAGVAAVVSSKNCAPPSFKKKKRIVPLRHLRKPCLCAQGQLGLFGCGCFWELAGWSVLIPGLSRRVEKFVILCPASGVGARTLKQAIPFSHQHVYYFL
jgi:hypothetical protein